MSTTNDGRPAVESLLLNITDAAALLGFSVTYMQRMVKKGGVPTVTIGTRRYFYRETLKAFARTGRWPKTRKDGETT